MAKWIFCTGCILFLSSGSQAFSENKAKELEKIDSEIQILKQNLHQEQLQEMKEEVEGQGLMIGDWDAYSKKLQLIRKQEEDDKKIENDIHALEERKKRILQNQVE